MAQKSSGEKGFFFVVVLLFVTAWPAGGERALHPRAVSTIRDAATNSFPPGGRFARAVASAGDVNGDGFDDVLIGAPQWFQGGSGQGKVFVYHGSPSGFAAEADWSADGDQTLAEFGFAVAPAGDVNNDGFDDVIVGAHRYDTTEEDAGWVAVYHGSAAGLSATPDWTASGDQAFARFGVSVASAGDIDNDGFSDVIVGASHYDAGETDEGRAYVYRGSAGGLSATQTWLAEPDLASVNFGYSVSSAGDVNDDGHDDVVVGGPGFSLIGGRVFVYLGSAGGLSTTAVWRYEETGDLGVSVSGGGDFNGDGFDDVVAGDWANGRSYIFRGPSLSTITMQPWTVRPSNLAGWSVSIDGDVNGDGRHDLIIGTPYFGLDEGMVWVYHGAPTGPGSDPDTTLPGADPWLYFGISVAAAGDIDADGFDEVIAGNCPTCSDGTWSIRERALVFSGSTAGVSTSPIAPLTGDLPGPAGELEALLRLRHVSGFLELSWDSTVSCHTGILDYVIYEGTLGDFASHVPQPHGGFDTECTTFGTTSTFFDPRPGNRYYLVVPRKTDVEGSYGLDSSGVKRLPSAQACAPQSIDSCGP